MDPSNALGLDAVEGDSALQSSRQKGRERRPRSAANIGRENPSNIPHQQTMQNLRRASGSIQKRRSASSEELNRRTPSSQRSLGVADKNFAETVKTDSNQ